MDRIELELYLNKVLETARFKDYCPNGLQVEGRRRVNKIATGVSASLAFLEAALDWDRRHQLMRMHTAMHLLCSLIKGAAVTGGSVGADKSRLDFDLPNPPPKEEIEAGLNALIEADHPVRIEWVDESVLDTDPGLVRTLSVQPRRGTGRLRLVRIGANETLVDLQPCGGTHVSRTSEIGRIRVQKIENKGKQNRRIIIVPG